MEVLKNKKGDSYIYLCVIVIFVCLLISAVIMYMSLTAQAQIQKNDIQAKLDSYVASFAPKGYDALKQGSTKDSYIDWEEFEANAYAALGFSEESVSVYEYESGNCSITRPTITVLRGEGFGITAEYTAIYPVIWNGQSYSALEIPVTVTSYYKMK